MRENDLNFRLLSPKAPPELAKIAYLVGKWRCDAMIQGDGDNWLSDRAEWIGRFILDGFAIADEYRMTDAGGTLVVLGLNVRSYDAITKRWNMKWLSALTGAWTDLASPELGGVTFEGDSMRYAFPDSVGQHAYTRATYTRRSDVEFTWLGEKSDDGRRWTPFMKVEAHRA